MDESYDVAVIGGGPGGTAAACFLQKSGHRCVLFERAAFPRYSIGESLIPHSYGTLDRLGLIPKLRESAFTKKFSVRFVSPDGRDSDPFYFSETIEGNGAQTWQVDRDQFDLMCREHAIECGVHVRKGVVEHVDFADGRAVGVRVRSAAGTGEFSARVIVDASGRATALGNQLDLKESIPSLCKSTVWSYYRGGARGVGLSAGETTILLFPDKSWAWYIPLLDDVVSVGIVGDTETIFHGDEAAEEAFLRHVAASPGLGERLSTAQHLGPVRGGRQHLAYRNRETVGDGWVMVGDARAFLDPIYSSGVFLALESAEQAALSIHEALVANDVSKARLGTFEPRLNAGVDVISQLIHAFYDPSFGFGEFLRRHPDQRPALIDCLVGDVFKDMSSFTAALASLAHT
ncbi:MAG: NAD(P)/FAD-dependent oxidoreductase [bacterium]|nr:NAD(P)/FAD-dependent oxidoreductase [bacterium]